MADFIPDDQFKPDDQNPVQHPSNTMPSVEEEGIQSYNPLDTISDIGNIGKIQYQQDTQLYHDNFPAWSQQHAMNTAIGSIQSPKSIKFKIESDPEQGLLEVVHPTNSETNAAGQMLGGEYEWMIDPEHTGIAEDLPYKNMASLDNLSVHPDLQNQGIGSKLIKQFEKEAIKNGADAIYLNASPMGVGSKARDPSKLGQLIDFYQSHGYRPFGPLEEENQMMIKDLRKSSKKNYAHGGITSNDFETNEADKLDKYLFGYASGGFIPDSQFVPDAPSPAPQSQQAPDFIPEDQFTSDEDKYGSPTEQAKAFLEGAASSATFGASTGVETALGANPQDIRLRRENNPITYGVGQVAGLAGSAVAMPELGAAKILGGAGEAAAALTGLGGKGASVVSQLGADAVKGAFEGMLFQGGDEISKAFTADPNQTAHSAIVDLGLSTVMGGILGPVFGMAARKLGTGSAFEALDSGKIAPESQTGSFVSEVDQPKMQAGDFETSIKNSDILSEPEKKGIIEGLREQKPDAPEIKAAADRLGAPVLEGMTSASKAVQRAEDSLINGAPTYSGLKRQGLYKNAYGKASAAAESTLANDSNLSKAELGNVMKQNLTNQIEEQTKPINDLYNIIKQTHDMIPVDRSELPQLAKDISEIQELRLSPSSPEGALANRVSKELQNIQSVDDVKSYKSILNRSISPTASSGEKRMASVLSDKLSELENSSIEKFAKDMATTPEQEQLIKQVIDQRTQANAQYKGLIEKVQTLAQQLGRKRIYGPQDAINFIDDLAPEKITDRLFYKGNSEFLKFFKEEFPVEMQLMQGYQKNVLKEAASTTGEFIPKKLFNQVNKLEPEIQKSIFSDKELQRLQDSETYLRSFPKDFNPSHTAHESAFRQFFEHGLTGAGGAAVANARDFAIVRFIKAFGSSNNPDIKQASFLAKATIKGFNAGNKAIKSIVSDTGPAISSIAAAQIPTEKERKKLDNQVSQYIANPQDMMKIGQDLPVPEYSSAFSATAARAVQYLSAMKPSTAKLGPLDPDRVPSKAEEAKYNRALDIAQKPLIVLQSVKTGNITPQDVTTFQSIYPDLYQRFASKMNQEIVEHTNKGKTIPYKSRLSMSLFLGTNLDSTMTPQAILAAQPASPTPMPQPGATKGSGKQKGSMKAFDKLPDQYQTIGQHREAMKVSGKS